MKKKILVVELWGLGDLSFSIPFLRAATRDHDVHIVGKSYVRQLLHPSCAGLTFTYFDAPWTRFRGKYKLWEWNWGEVFRVARKLRGERFDIGVSIRSDPRDHLLMWLLGIRDRYGYPRRGSSILLNHRLHRPAEKRHRVEDWRDLGRALHLDGIENAEPSLRHAGYRSARVDSVLDAIHKPIVCLHAGARISVRRWPEPYFAEIIRRMRGQFDFHLLLIPDPDGCGSSLAPLADTVIGNLTVREMVCVLGRSDLLLCNDSGPSHIAAECGRPVIAIFGPTEPAWFRPWGADHLVVNRDICPWRPCFDYCLFPEPYCMTKLLPDYAWPQIRAHIDKLIDAGKLTPQLRPPDRRTLAA
jgi:heptosyltransferase-2